jgi:DNA-binding MarR family transcriptional regulator
MRSIALHKNITEDWRLTHLGRVLGHAMRRFDARVLAIMAHDVQAPLVLSNLAAKAQISAAHIHLMRHLPMQGARLVDLAQSAGMSKQAMASLVLQCEAWGLVTKGRDARDARAKSIVFTPLGKQWLAGFERAVRQAETEFAHEVGGDIATVVKIGLEAYAHGYEV